ncbi:hypothetical protein BDA99DRAFT_539310 [Phascolomyces articulosus]|uniref:NAD(P)-binding protein n=1 Tax=Phascolomyces articulosus TaxID=60185 RepID=A0AAD5JW91_9FUNG|nr:hypothetical protein BDA99DRAFT_539310 [Phascolomyces articulosus]
MSATQSGRIIFITGGSGGLGRSVAKRFLSEGHTVVITGRTDAKLKQAVEWINPSNPKRLHTIILDLESLSSIRGAVESFKALGFPTLDILINNAGRTTVNHEFVADTKIVEKTIFANAVGPWYLTMLLRPSIPSGGRILFVTSSLHDPDMSGIFTGMSNDQVKSPNLFNMLDGNTKFNGLAYYKISKLATVWITYVMAKQYPDLVINTMCPGFVPVTSLNRDQPWIFRAVLKFSRHLLSESVTEEQSISEYVYYTTSEELNGVTGVYFTHGKKSKSSKRSYNMKEATRFWNLACDICNTPKYNLEL